MKNYIVTSATDGIGRCIVENLLETNGDNINKIIVNYGHNEEKAARFLEENEAYKEKICLIKADLSSFEGLEAFVSSIHQTISTCDYLICNTGISAYGRFDDYTWEMWNHVITTNLSIPVFLIKEIKNMMNPDGSILLMGSDAGIRSYSSSLAYSISKAGIIHLAKVLVKELEPLGVRVNALAPGFIETGWQKDRSQESRDRINKKIAQHRFGKPEEVAQMACNILSNSYVNGSVYEINGGYEYF